MKRTPWIIVAALAAASCESTPWSGDRAEPVDAAYLMDISADDREEIAKLRADEAALQDEVAFAEREIEAKKADKNVSEQELDIAKQEVEEAEARIDAARTTEETDAARERLNDAKMHVAWADAQVDYQEARIDWAEAKRDLAERKRELGTARVEQRKARAVDELPEGSKAPRLEMAAYDESLAEAELEVRLAEIDLQAAADKAEAHRDAMGKLAEHVPEGRRSAWRTTVVEPSDKEP